MARVPIINAETAGSTNLRSLFRELEEMGLEKFNNQLGTLAHHPALAQAVFSLLRAYYYDSVVPRKFLEMAILLVSARNRCEYCVVHHTPMALNAGLSEAQLQAINELTWEDSGLFDATERTVLAFVDKVSANSGRVDDRTFAELRSVFNEQQVVELTVRAAMCEFFNRFNEVFQIDLEPVAEVLYKQASG